MAPRHPVRLAMEAGDIDGVIRHFAADFTLRSPVTRASLHGEDSHRLLRTVLASYERWECLAEFRDGPDHVLVTHARIGGRDVEIVDLMREGPDGNVVEFTAYSRPLDGTASFAQVVAPLIARQRSRVRAVVVALLTRPLPALLAFGDKLVSALAAMHAPGR
jgi:hypothetical protein